MLVQLSAQWRVALAVAAMAAGCSFAPTSTSASDDRDGSTDTGDSGIDAPGADASPEADAFEMPTGPFGNITALTVLNSPAIDDDPSVTADLLEIYFGSDRTGGAGDEDIWFSTRGSPTEPWRPPTPVATINSFWADGTPCVSPDGLTLYFASSRPGGLGSYDVYVSTRPNRQATWGSPQYVPELSSTSREFGPYAVTPVRLYLGSDRGGGDDEDIYVAERANPDDPWGTPRLVSGLDTPQPESTPWLTADERVVYFHVITSPIDIDLYVAVRASPDAGFGARTGLSELNTPGNDSDPWLSPDQRTIWWTSDRGGAGLDLYVATR